MPKKRTKAQLERALTDLELRFYTLETKCNSATERADIATKNLEETEELALRDELDALEHRAEAAETNLIHFRAVSLGMLDIVKLAATPAQLMKPPGISLGSKPSAKDVLGILADDA